MNMEFVSEDILILQMDINTQAGFQVINLEGMDSLNSLMVKSFVEIGSSNYWMAKHK